jgi:hydrogenase nickel incorporation protein HypB
MGRIHRHDDGSEHVHDEVDDHFHTDDGEHSATRGDHSGYGTGTERIEILERIFGENDRCAAANRAALELNGTCAINLMSSPGAGKTTLLAAMLRALPQDIRIGVVEGDIETSIDADRLSGLGAVVELINTGNGFGGECHLDAPMVRSALTHLPLDRLDLVLIENVGNLVCPAEFDVGEHARAMIFSITEGEDKPLKYPVMFRSADVVFINKIDLLPHLDFDMSLFQDNLCAVNPAVPALEVSSRTGTGVDECCAWLMARLAMVRATPASMA